MDVARRKDHLPMLLMAQPSSISKHMAFSDAWLGSTKTLVYQPVKPAVRCISSLSQAVVCVFFLRACSCRRRRVMYAQARCVCQDIILLWSRDKSHVLITWLEFGGELPFNITWRTAQPRRHFFSMSSPRRCRIPSPRSSWPRSDYQHSHVRDARCAPATCRSGGSGVKIVWLDVRFASHIASEIRKLETTSRL